MQWFITTKNYGCEQIMGMFQWRNAQHPRVKNQDHLGPCIRILVMTQMASNDCKAFCAALD